jgi:hypothetical protein
MLTNPKGKGKLWIETTYLPWLLTYIADEVSTGSVKLQESAVAGGDSCSSQLRANCDMPWVNIRLKPQDGCMNQYVAVFVDGPLKDKTYTSSVDKFSQKKWDACNFAEGPTWDDASPEDVHRATAHFLEVGCARQLLQALGQASDVADPIYEAKCKVNNLS